MRAPGGAGRVLIGGVLIGATAAWALLTQPFVAMVVVAFVWIAWALQSRQRAALAGLLLGQGVASFALTLFLAGEAQASTWLLVSAAIALVGVVVLWFAGVTTQGGKGRTSGFAMSVALVVGAIVAAVMVAFLGLPLRPGEYALPTRQSPAWLSAGCAGVGLDAAVRGDPGDPRVVWLENKRPADVGQGALRLEAIWPAGYRARFSPSLEVLDGFGNVVLKDGDAIGGACGVDDTGRVFDLAPPFR